jgi:hypothetical protein
VVEEEVVKIRKEEEEVVEIRKVEEGVEEARMGLRTKISEYRVWLQV